MTFGDKIKKARKEQGKTQKEIAGNKITRNMLSLIESDKTVASLETAKYLADRLSLPIGYLLSEDDDIFHYIKKDAISEIKALYANKSFLKCVKKIEAIGQADDELSYILAECYFALAKNAVLNGSLHSGAKYINSAMNCSQKTVYNTSHIECGCLLYGAIASNIQAPLLELNISLYEKIHLNSFDFEFYKYVLQDNDYKFDNQTFANHSKARILIKNRRFNEALKLLCEIEEEKNKYSYNSYSVFAVYSDLERCYREIGDYENAYKYANKRLSLLEGFKQ